MRPRILKQETTLTKFQQEVLIGYLLGDGCLETWKNSKVARLKVEQGVDQAMFVQWLYQVFQDFIKTPPKLRRHSFSFNTLSFKQFYDFHRLFYFDSKKVIPKNIENYLTPLSLSVWFMSDGSVKSKECNGRIINTHAFTELELINVCKILQDKFFIKSSIRRQKDGLQIYISAKSAGRLSQIISQYTLPIFQYKLPKFKY